MLISSAAAPAAARAPFSHGMPGAASRFSYELYLTHDAWGERVSSERARGELFPPANDTRRKKKKKVIPT